MKVKDLKKQINDLPDEMEVFIRCTYNPVGNMVDAGKAEVSTYGFFGKNIDCVIIEPDSDE